MFCIDSAIMVLMLIIYTKTGCPWCIEALQYLNEIDISFEERNVSTNEDFYKELLEKTNQQKCPTLDLNGKILPDAGKEEIEIFLKENKLV
jgi:glutaredoxin 3